jgi:hypothetical protein
MLNLLLNLTVGLDPKLSSLLMLMAIDLLTDVAQVKVVLLVPVLELEFELARILGTRRRSAGMNRFDAVGF